MHNICQKKHHLVIFLIICYKFIKKNKDDLKYFFISIEVETQNLNSFS
jgi:hypothetical protein